MRQQGHRHRRGQVLVLKNMILRSRQDCLLSILVQPGLLDLNTEHLKTFLTIIIDALCLKFLQTFVTVLDSYKVNTC